MKVRIKITLCMLGLLSLLFGIGGSLLIAMSFQDALEREKEVAFSSYQMVFETLQIVNEFSSVLDYETVERVVRQLDEQSSRNWLALRISSPNGYTYEANGAEQYIGELVLSDQVGTASFQYGSAPEGGQCLLLTGRGVG